MRLCTLLVYIFGFISPPFCMAQATGNCLVSIFTERNSGEKLRINFQSTLHSKKECQHLAQMHQPNFTPDQVRSKTVTYRWNGPATYISTQTKTKPIKRSELAYAKKQKSKRGRLR